MGYKTDQQGFVAAEELREIRRNARVALAGTELLSYELNLWLYTKSWDRF